MKPLVFALFATTLLLAGIPAEADQPTVLIDHTGPLPISSEFTTGSVGPATLVVSGSVWTTEQNRQIGVEVIFEGETIGEAWIWSNAPNTHRAVVTRYFQISLDKQFTGDPPVNPPSYTVELRAMNADTLSDDNDFFSVVLLE